jgi:ribonuclease HII
LRFSAGRAQHAGHEPGPESERSACAPAAERRDRPPELPARAERLQARHLAGRRLRRGRARTARRAGRCRRGGAGSGPDPARAQRFQEADLRGTRKALRPHLRIDRDNILQASLWALAQAVAALPCRPKLVYVDGRDRIKVPCDCEPVISGDALVLSIAAASIVAKVTRDRLMMQIGAAHPGYGFERHMGYSVPEHFAALQRLGPTIHHRRSFSPVAVADGLKAPPATDDSPLGLPL